MKRSLALAFLCLIISLASRLQAEKPLSENVRIYRYPARDRWGLIVRSGTLSFDNSAKKVTILADAGYNEDPFRLEVAYDDIAKASFEITTHMRGITPNTALLGFASLPGVLVANRLAAQTVDTCWLYLSYKESSADASILFSLPADGSQLVIDTATKILGAKATVIGFEKGVDLEFSDAKNVNSQFVIKVDKNHHPLPEIRSDKATVVIACPGRASGLAAKRLKYRLYADDKLIAVNAIGTYDIAYLDPGKYRLVSQQKNANGLEVELEAGRQYFFLQNLFEKGWVPNESVLSQNSPELVTFLLHGSYFSNWKLKN